MPMAKATAGIAAAVFASATLVAPAEAAAPQFLIAGIQYDPAGKDTRTNAHINLEYISIRNNTTRPLSLKGYRIRDAASHVYFFPPTFVLKARTTVLVHTGKGRNSANHLYWGSGNYIWNNTGDTARLQNSLNRVIDFCTYQAVTGRAAVTC
ncbi:lamin tail domain-containing protein [Kribbella albertanoniae]|uniref:Lamin tail domain-containing protein n=2 Tax=Kribbella albertanoniae TaxID=1266829 RepID=A0A4V2XR61_9ACTN|nr:lamin tail domain-containing protein [Kribbella albertanoniae]